MKKKPKTPRTVVQFAIFQKVAGVPFPGDFWEEHGQEEKARRRLQSFYDEDGFRLVKVTYEEIKS